MKRSVVMLLSIFALLVFGTALVSAQVPPGMQESLNMINSMYGTNYACAPCHGPTGPPLNGYGQAFVNAGGNPFLGDTIANRVALAAIQPLDSDGDLFSNIAEINARTLPGDPASVPSSAVMPSPVSGQQVIDVAASSVAVPSADPVRAVPIEFGGVASGVALFRVGVALLSFSAPVDLFFGVQAPAALQSNEIFLLSDTGALVPVSTALVPWRRNVTATLSVPILPDLPLSVLPDGMYTFFLAATPVNSSLSTFYLWVSDFTVGPRDLVFHLRSMTPHVNQLTEVRVVSDDGVNSLKARAILDPLPSASFDLVMPKAVPAGNHRLDFFSDFNNNRSYNAPPVDHAWRLPLPATSVAETTFVHNTSFTDIGLVPNAEGGAFTLSLTGMTPHVGQLMELRVIKLPKQETVGYYRLGAIGTANFTITIPGIIENGVSYQVDFYADFNNSKTYNAPPVDHAWRLTGTGGPAGLSLNFVHNTNFTDIGF